MKTLKMMFVVMTLSLSACNGDPLGSETGAHLQLSAAPARKDTAGGKGGGSDSCSATRRRTGRCGSAESGTTTSPPSSNLCGYGSASSVSTRAVRRM